MKPCDCEDMVDVQKLSEFGLVLNNSAIRITPPNVILDIGPCILEIRQNYFKRFAEWYLKDQAEEL